MAESMTSILDRMDTMDNPALLPWNKLEKAFKLQKLNEFAERFAQEKALLPEQRARLKDALKERLSRKQLQKTKDVAYDKARGMVMHIDCLVCHPDGTFGFRNTDSVSPLAALAPKTRRSRVDVGVVLNHTS
jgi:50S ribosomal subunit-associated GTPase HflX